MTTGTRTAVHFGAGNIGRGFVGLLLHEAGYEVVFADVAAPLIDALAAADSYTVHEVGQGAQDHEVTAFRAVTARRTRTAWSPRWPPPTSSPARSARPS